VVATDDFPREPADGIVVRNAPRREAVGENPGEVANATLATGESVIDTNRFPGKQRLAAAPQQ